MLWFILCKSESCSSLHLFLVLLNKCQSLKNVGSFKSRKYIEFFQVKILEWMDFYMETLKSDSFEKNDCRKNRFTPRFNHRTCLETVKIYGTWIMMWMNTTSFYYSFWIKFFILDLDNKIWIWSVVWKKKKNLLKFNLTILNIGSSNKIELHSINSV